jgi:hypothetical protein
MSPRWTAFFCAFGRAVALAVQGRCQVAEKRGHGRVQCEKRVARASGVEFEAVWAVQFRVGLRPTQ